MTNAKRKAEPICFRPEQTIKIDRGGDIVHVGITRIQSPAMCCGEGAGTMLIMQRRFSKVMVSDSEISPTLEAGAGGAGTTCR